MRMSTFSRKDLEDISARLNEYGVPQPDHAVFAEALYEEIKSELPSHEVTKRADNLVFIKLIG